MKKSVILHSLLENGSLAQLNRASDYGSEGCRFESCTNHNLGASQGYREKSRITFER